MSVIHAIATLLSLTVSALVIGSICATIASWKHVPARTWFLGAAVVAVVAGIAGGWIYIALVPLPVLAAFAIPKGPITHELTLGGPRRENLLMARLLMVMAATLLPYAAMLGGIASVERTAVAQPKILDVRPIDVGAGNPWARPQTATHVEYTFEVAGHVYEDSLIAIGPRGHRNLPRSATTQTIRVAHIRWNWPRTPAEPSGCSRMDSFRHDDADADSLP